MLHRLVHLVLNRSVQLAHLVVQVLSETQTFTLLRSLYLDPPLKHRGRSNWIVCAENIHSKKTLPNLRIKCHPVHSILCVNLPPEQRQKQLVSKSKDLSCSHVLSLA